MANDTANSEQMTYGLTPAERRAWEEDGFFCRPSLFGSSEIDALRTAAEAVVKQAEACVSASLDHYVIDGNEYVEVPALGEGATVQLEHAPESRTIRVIEPFHGLHPVFDELVDDARIVQPICELVGTEEVALFSDKMNLKRPQEGSRFDWHQDSPYWAHFCEHLDQLPNVMITLDDADEENGCFRVVRGSHKKGCLPGRTGDGTLGPLFTHPDHFDEGDQVLIRVPAGSLVFFSPHTVHGSRPNRSDRARRALVLTYQPSGLRMFKADRVRSAGDARGANG
ncbi:MAG: phytanoyl-CoA dioxygenase family protein [bacterium]|nr:phytanoyl-CoA dioxygenase family protein [bacterium]